MKKRNKEIWRLTALAVMVASQVGCHIEVVGVDDDDDWDRYEVSATVSSTLDTDGITRLRVQGLNGTIHITGVAGAGTVSVRAEKTVRSRSRSDAQEHLDLLDVSTGREGGDLVVETLQPQNTGRRDYIVDYQITMPMAMALRIINGNGSVDVHNLGADLRVENGNGGVVVRGQRGSSRINVGNGQIDARVEMPQDGEIVHRVGNGWIDLELLGPVSAQLGAHVGNGTISHSGLSFSSLVTGPGILQGTIGTGSGLIDLTVGNGWVKVRGD